jgi:hypothetical protein
MWGKIECWLKFHSGKWENSKDGIVRNGVFYCWFRRKCVRCGVIEELRDGELVELT